MFEYIILNSPRLMETLLDMEIKAKKAEIVLARARKVNLLDQLEKVGEA